LATAVSCLTVTLGTNPARRDAGPPEHQHPAPRAARRRDRALGDGGVDPLSADGDARHDSL